MRLHLNCIFRWSCCHFKRVNMTRVASIVIDSCWPLGSCIFCLGKACRSLWNWIDEWVAGSPNNWLRRMRLPDDFIHLATSPPPGGVSAIAGCQIPHGYYTKSFQLQGTQLTDDWLQDLITRPLGCQHDLAKTRSGPQLQPKMELTARVE